MHTEITAGKSAAIDEIPRKVPNDPGMEFEVLAQLFDYIDYPIFVAEPSGALVWSNQLGDLSLTNSDVIKLDDNLIVPTVDTYLERWQQKLIAASAGEEGLLFVEDGEFSQAVSINPMRHPTGLSNSASTISQSRYVVIILGKSSPCKPLALSRFSGSFKLTPAEQRVVAQLLAGLAPCKIASLNSVTEATIRTQIKSVLAKTGFQSIRNLILEISRLPPVSMASTRAQ